MCNFKTNNSYVTFHYLLSHVTNVCAKESLCRHSGKSARWLTTQKALGATLNPISNHRKGYKMRNTIVSSFSHKFFTALVISAMLLMALPAAPAYAAATITVTTTDDQ